MADEDKQKHAESKLGNAIKKQNAEQTEILITAITKCFNSLSSDLARKSVAINSLTAAVHSLQETINASKNIDIRNVNHNSTGSGGSSGGGGGGASADVGAAASDNEVNLKLNINSWFKKVAIPSNYDGLCDKYMTPENIELLKTLDDSFAKKNESDVEAYKMYFAYAIWTKKSKDGTPLLNKEDKDIIIAAKARWVAENTVAEPIKDQLSEE